MMSILISKALRMAINGSSYFDIRTLDSTDDNANVKRVAAK
jgi:hypothetical protein